MVRRTTTALVPVPNMGASASEVSCPISPMCNSACTATESRLSRLTSLHMLRDCPDVKGELLANVDDR